jgi:anti-anti-sigma regulatory factor
MRNAKIKFEPDVANAGTMNVLIEGDLTLQNMEEIKAELTNAFEKSQKLHLILQNVENIDISCFQMLFSVHKTYKESNTEIAITITLSDDHKKLVGNAGLLNFLASISNLN